MINTALLFALGLSSVVVYPPTVDGFQTDRSTCGERIIHLENEVQNAIDSSSTIHFIETGSNEFKSLSQRYDMFWVDTKYLWNTDVSTCSAKLVGIETSFQLSNSSSPYIGMANITVDPSMRITNVNVELA